MRGGRLAGRFGARIGTSAGLGPLRTMLLGLGLMLPLGGCLLTDKPEPGLEIPLAYDRASKNPAVAEAAVPPLDWWRGFRSRELIEVIEEAREANLDIGA